MCTLLRWDSIQPLLKPFFHAKALRPFLAGGGARSWVRKKFAVKQNLTRAAACELTRSQSVATLGQPPAGWRLRFGNTLRPSKPTSPIPVKTFDTRQTELRRRFRGLSRAPI
jgi:hypothetical protein